MAEKLNQESLTEYLKTEPDKDASGYFQEDRKAVIKKASELLVYEVNDFQLHLILQSVEASPGSFFLDFAIGCLSAAISFLIALLTVPFSSPHPTSYYVFVIFVINGFLAGIIFFILWLKGFRKRKSTEDLINEIKGIEKK